MTLLLLGLILFLGVHSVRAFADGWRSQMIERLGPMPWKGIYSIASIVGFVLVIWGFSLARTQPVQLWSPPVGMRHLASLLTLLSFILLAAAYVPGNHIKARVGHPMVLGVKTWALAHLLANGNLAHVLLFGGFLAWSVVLFVVSRRRDRSAGTVYPPGRSASTGITVVAGALAWAAFAFWLHGLLIGIRPVT
jgi:uncharacterized membrane protein